MIFKQIETPQLSIYTYIVGDSESKECVVIDPPRVIQSITDYIDSHKLILKAILETHVHADFVSGSKELKRFYGGKPLIYCSELGGLEWVPSYADQKVREGTKVKAGKYELLAKYTPGHTPEHVIWLLNDGSMKAFTGDLLFSGGVGRPDLLGNRFLKQLSKDLYDTLFVRIADLPDETEIYPAHGGGSMCAKSAYSRSHTTLGHERKFNPSLQKLPEMEWIEALQADMPAAPMGFFKNKTLNVKGAKFMGDLTLPFEIDIEAINSQGAFVLDIRDALTFAKGHLRGAVNIPYSPQFCSWAEMVIPQESKIILIVPVKEAVPRITKDLWLAGFENIIEYAVYKPTVGELELNLVEPIEIGDPSKWTLVDVRTPAEWASGHVENAYHLELGKVAENLNLIPKDKPIAVICRSGTRASIAASLLQKEGHGEVSNLKGGMLAWDQAGLPSNK